MNETEDTEEKIYFTIEQSRGATYNHPDRWAVYSYDTYPDSSVLAGQTRRVWHDDFESVEAAKAAYPEAEVSGCGYQPPDLSHITERDEIEEYYSMEEDE